MTAQTFGLGFPNLIYDATVAGGSWLAAAPVSNVQTRPLANTARSSSVASADTKITIDHGSAKAARALVLLRHNLTSAATVRWKRGTTAGGTDVADSGDVNAWQFTPRAFDGSVYDAQILLTSQASARYETIEIVDTANSAGYIEVGRVMVCPLFEPTWNPSYGLRDGHEDLSEVGMAYSGADWPTANNRPRTVQFALQFLTLAEGDTLHEMEQIEGTTEEVLYLPYTDTPARMQRYGMVGLLRELSGIEYPTVNTRSRGFSIRQRK